MNMDPSFAPNADLANPDPDRAGSFANARPLAQHCAELTWRGPRPEERAENISAWCRDLGTELAQELAQLFSGGKFKVTISEPEMLPGNDVFERIGKVAVNSLLRCGEGDQTMLFSIDYPTAIALTDCSFGGDGAVSEDACEQLPRSAGMLVEKVAAIFAQIIAMSNGSAQYSGGDVLVRSESVTRLKPFSAAAQVAFFRVTMAMGDKAQWSAALAVENDRLATLLPGSTSKLKSPESQAPSDGTSGAFAAMPLPLEAVLGEIDMPLGRLETLAAGDEIPLVIPRELPLRVGEKTFAHGTLGTLENRMALRVTRLPDQAGRKHPPQFRQTNGVAP